LRTYGTEEWHREQNRVRLAIIKVSGGNLERLATCVNPTFALPDKIVASRGNFPRWLRASGGGGAKTGVVKTYPLESSVAGRR
jgi:hypothetical protein